MRRVSRSNLIVKQAISSVVVVVVAGCASVGITVTMVNPLANLTEITYQLENTKARALFVFPMFAQNAYNAKKDVPRIRDIFLYGETTRKTHEHRAGAESDKFDLYVKFTGGGGG